MKKLLIIGGGPAGMMAAITAAEQGCAVHLFEQNEKFGKKLFITGKGRCNFTNACDPEELFSGVITNGKFLYSAFTGFPNDRTISFMEALGVRTKVERGGRAFPASDHSSDVIRGLERRMKALDVKLHLNSRVTGLSIETLHDNSHEESCEASHENSTEDVRENSHKKPRKDSHKKPGGNACIRGIRLENGAEIKGDAVIIATGGCSYPSTGSTGDGLRFAKAAGHTIRPVRPALVPLETKEAYIPSLQGLSLKNVTLTIGAGKKKAFEGFGEMLFTHFGISGPLVLSASSVIGKKLEQQPLPAWIDLKPALSKEQLDARLVREFDAAKNKQLGNCLPALLPAKLIPVFSDLAGIPLNRPIREITREERQKILSLLKAFPFTITGSRGFREAIITQGGVHVKEVLPATMESRLVKGLYFAGEVLDLDAVTGGYNLQIAWSTGYAAGMAAAQRFRLA